MHPQDGGSITNQASVSSPVDDQNTGNNSASAATTVNPVADLSITKSDSPDPLLAGELLTYTLGVHNSGPSNATAVTVTDPLPAGAAFDSATPTQGSCSHASGTVTCTLGALANGANAGIDIKVRPQIPGTITNTAGVTSAASDPSSANNSASTNTTVDPAADISLTKTDAPDPALEGEQVTYTLTAHNAGPQNATGVVLTDTLPGGVTFDSATPSQGAPCNESSGTVTCNLGTIADDADATVEIKVTPQGPGTLTNQASITSDLADPDTADRSASAVTTVDPAADLSLTKGDAPDPVLAGQQLTYTLAVANSGPRTATGVQLTDNLPSTVTFNSATPSQGSCSHASGTVTCALGTLANTGSATVTIVVTPQEGGTITNQATVSSDLRDPTSPNNAASAQTTVNPAADLELTKTDSPDPVLAGELLTYTLAVHNAGPSSAAATQLIDTLPEGVVFVSAVPTQGTCSESSGTVDCGLGTLANGATVNVEVKIRPQTPGTITNQAGVVSLALDADTGDNNASAATTVNAAADLSLTKSDSPDPVLVGGTLTYTLTAHNSGPQDTTGVTLTDSLPAGVDFVSATPTQGLCDEASGTVTCLLGALISGANASVDIVVTPQSVGSITNQASVTSDLADPDAADASASATTTVDPVADLSLTKSDAPDPVLAEHELTYTLSVHNAGPSSAAGTTLIDALPSGVTFGSATPSQGSCTQSSGTVTCPLGTIASGGNASVEIKVTPTTAGSITNSASVGSGASDPNASNNLASASTTVNQSADLSVSMTDSPDPVVTNEVLSYTVTVHNAGPTSAPGVTLTDTMPSGTAYVSAFPSQGSCSQVSLTVTCPLGTMANGADATVVINIRPSTAGSITNQVSVASAASDPASGNNQASAGTTVNAAVGYPRPKGATPLRVPLVIAYAACTSPNRIHGPALASPSCNPPVRASNYLTVGTPDANGATANATGTVRIDVAINANPTPERRGHDREHDRRPLRHRRQRLRDRERRRRARLHRRARGQAACCGSPTSSAAPAAVSRPRAETSRSR